jgi:hypothetical protein
MSLGQSAKKSNYPQAHPLQIAGLATVAGKANVIMRDCQKVLSSFFVL